MIREFTITELEESNKFFEFMREFEGATNVVRVDADHCREKYLALMRSGIARIFVAEENGKFAGAIGFLLSEDLHYPEKLGVETFWYVNSKYAGIGKELFKVFESEAIKAGCTKLAMIHLVDSHPERLKTFYIKQGYKLLESHYVKEI